MTLKPIQRMLEAIEVARSDSDVALFLELMYLGELTIKTLVAGLVAAVLDDRDRHRYRQLHRLVRADSLGEWTAALDDVLAGPSAQFLAPKARDVQRELTQLVSTGTWQYDAAALLHNCLRMIDPGFENLPSRADGRRAFALFVALRNKTRGHGATHGEMCSRLCSPLEQALRLVIQNELLFDLHWAYLHRNLSGKYRVTSLTTQAAAFDYLKATSTTSLLDGVHVFFDAPARVDLMDSTVDAIDFFYPNGGFTGTCYEMISYATDTKVTADATPYLAPAIELPESETQGIGTLDVQGRVFGNLPPPPEGYIERRALEAELYEVLVDDRHPIVSLAGRGGIGKTSLALRILHRIADSDRYAAILWFSSRDIDLLPQGPKLVRPQVVSREDLATDFANLLQPASRQQKGFKPLNYIQECLTKSPVGPLLIVVDNFETVRGPIEMFTWLDNSVRNPNKILITTRQREFKADFPVEVLGMSEDEADRLITATASSLGLTNLVVPSYRQEVYRESDGHPYVIKILLGEVAKAGHLVKVERIVASKDDVLDALFERTYAGLSPVGKRVFLTLSNWQSTLPALAVEAAMLRPDRERLDVDSAIEELHRTSFIEVRVSTTDSETFLTVPLVSSIFGRRKLAVSELKAAVDADTELLHLFGAAQPTDIKHGVAPRIQRLFRHIATRVSQNQADLDLYLPMLELIATKFPPAWLLLSQLHEESGTADGVERAKQAVRRYLEVVPDTQAQRPAWDRLASLCLATADWSGEIQATVASAVLPGTPFGTISDAANRLNGIFRHRGGLLDTYEKQVVVRRLVEVMETRLDEADSTDCSRLGWLSLHLGDIERAKRYASRGLRLDGENEHCYRLARRFGLL